MGTNADARSWQRQYRNVTIIPSSKNAVKTEAGTKRLRYDEYFTPAETHKLESGIALAPKMVDAALELLRNHQKFKGQFNEQNRRTTGLRRPVDIEIEDTQVGYGLFKYFNLVRDPAGVRQDSYWNRVQGIIKVFEKIKSGIEGAYELVVADLGTGTNARVKSHGEIRTTPVSSIRATFDFPDEYGHTSFTWPERRGRIQITHFYITKRETDASQIGRTIVHEASHKWADTKDVLYKSQTWAKLAKNMQDDLTDIGVTPARIDRPGKAKPLYALAGMGTRPEDDSIAAEQWLENADSYAWLARRLWKLEGRRQTHFY